jgi:integrin beta 3
MSASAQTNEEAWVELGEEINTVVRDGFARRDARINALEARIARLEADNEALRKELDAREHKGVWDAARGYLKHNQVTYDGSGWIAVRDTRARPGTPDSGWKLTTKRGRDGKDAR